MLHIRCLLAWRKYDVVARIKNKKAEGLFNGQVIGEIESRLKTYEAKSIEALERANVAKEKAVSEARIAEEALASYLDKENLKCRYNDTSLRMIHHLTKKYSEEKLKRTISCTSQECEEILRSESSARLVCNNS